MTPLTLTRRTIARIHEKNGKPEHPEQTVQDDIFPPWLREQLLRRFHNDLACRLESFFGEHSSADLPKNLSPTDVSRFHSQRERIIEYSLEQAGSCAWTTEQSVVEIFDQPDINRRLAVLGEPGSGKTACLLKVLGHLLEEARNDIQAQLPVVFECSEWNGKDLSSWMAHQLVVKYDLKKERAQQLVQADLIFPLFDGLDELKGELQDDFVEAFNAFQHGRPMLLCCRIKEYRQLEKNVKLNNALVLHDISAQRLEEYLRREMLDNLWQFLQKEPRLMELARRPLFLSIMLKLEEERLLSDNTRLKSEEDAEQFLWRLYLECCLDGTPPGELCSNTPGEKRCRYTEDQSLHWLRCMADRMTTEGIVGLRVEKLQPIWLNFPWKFKVGYGLIFGLLFGLIGGVSIGLVFGAAHGGLYGLALGIAYVSVVLLTGSSNWLTVFTVFIIAVLISYCFMGHIFASEVIGRPQEVILFYEIIHGKVATKFIAALTSGLGTGFALGLTSTFFISSKRFKIIQTVKVITLLDHYFFQNLKKISSGVLVGLVAGLLFSLLFQVAFFLGYGPNPGLIQWVISGLIGGVSAGIAFGFVFGFQKIENPIVNTTNHTQPFVYAVRNSFLLTPIFSTLGMIAHVRAFFLLEQLNFPVGSHFYMPAFWMYYFMLAAGCFICTGTDVIIGHYILRLLLWQEGQLPFRLVSWLEDLHQRKLLQRVGGSYHFIHKRLQEYLAQAHSTEMKAETIR